MLLSGGVDSTVCAALLRKSLNVDQIIAIHIDNGFMRTRESEYVRDSLAKIGLQVKGEFKIIVIFRGQYRSVYPQPLYLPSMTHKYFG